MGETGPSILVVDDDWDERRSIALLLREAGFDVAAVAPGGDALAAIDQRQFAAAVVALPDGEASEFLRRARRRQAGLKGLIVGDRAAMRLVDDNCATLITRPFDPRQLLGCVFALVLREEEQATVGHGHAAAEFGIAAAKLVCLHNRRIAAAAAGASRLAQELTQQISETAALHRGLRATL